MSNFISEQMKKFDLNILLAYFTDLSTIGTSCYKYLKAKIYKFNFFSEILSLFDISNEEIHKLKQPVTFLPLNLYRYVTGVWQLM